MFVIRPSHEFTVDPFRNDGSTEISNDQVTLCLGREDHKILHLLVLCDKKVTAVKWMRKSCMLGLKEAVDIYDAFRNASQSWPHPLY